jgi:hypothetical protein
MIRSLPLDTIMAFLLKKKEKPKRKGGRPWSEQNF